MDERVYMRVWVEVASDPDLSGVLAIFPDLPTHDGYVTCYEHVGQHGDGDLASCLERTRPATQAEYADLLAELRTLGYHPQVCEPEQG